MANNAVLTRLTGYPSIGYEWWQCFAGDGATNVKTTQTLDSIRCEGAVAVSVYFANLGWTDGTFTLTLQGSNNNSVWFTLGNAATAVGSANQTVSTGVVEGGALTAGTTGIAANIPRYCRALLTVTGSPATGSILDYIHIKIRHYGVTGG